jgi:hypothetical protein
MRAGIDRRLVGEYNDPVCGKYNAIRIVLENTLVDFVALSHFYFRTLNRSVRFFYVSKL